MAPTRRGGHRRSLAARRNPGPPRRFSSSPASRPIASASAAGPRRSVAISSEPSGLAIRPRRYSAPSASRIAWPAIGVRHEPSSTASIACSAATQVAVAAWLIAASQPRIRRIVDRGTRCRPRPGRRRAASRLPAPACRHAQAEPLEPGQREQGRLDLAGLALGAAACRHCRAAVTISRSGRRCSSCALPAQRGGADDRTLRQVGDASDVARDQHVARILARQERGDHQPGRQRRRHVLHAVHGDIDAPRQQRLLDLLDEQALAAGFGQRPVLDRVAGGPDHHDLDRIGRGERRHGRGERVAHQAGLGQRQLAAARAEAEERSAMALL